MQLQWSTFADYSFDAREEDKLGLYLYLSADD